MQFEILASKLRAISEKSAAYRQQENYSVYATLLERAGGSIDDGDFETANKSLGMLSGEIASSETAIAQKISDIDAALSNISVIELQFNASASKPMLLPANIAPERAQLDSAKTTAYSNPQLGIAMAAQASNSAAEKVKDSQTVSVAIAALAVMLGMAGLIAVVFYLHLRSRKRQGLEAIREGEQHKGKE